MIQDGLVLALDAADRNSYPGSGTTWRDLATNNSASLTNGPTFNSSNGGNIAFDGVDDYAAITETNLTGNWTISSWFKYDYTPGKTTIFNLPLSSGSKSGQITWGRSNFLGLSSFSFDTTGSLYFGTFGNGVWDNSVARFHSVKVDSTGSIDTNFNPGITAGSAANLHQVYIGNDGFHYSSGTNLGFFTKRDKQTGAFLSSAPGPTTLSAYFVIDEDNRKVYHMGSYTTAFSLPRSYICKFDLDTFAVDTIFNTSASLNAQPNQNQIFLTSDKYLYAFGENISSYKGTAIKHIVRIDQSGSLDPNFNPGTGFNDARQIICAMDSQNRLVCFGRLFSSYSGSSASGIIRINTNGTRDTTFVPGSFVSFLGVSSIAIQPDDKIIVTGYFTSYSGSASRGIVRINTNGSRDSTLNIGTGIGDVNASPAAVIQSDGKIILGQGNIFITHTYNGTPYKTFIRVNSSGSIDQTFNTGSGFTDTISRSEQYTRIRNTAGTLTTVTNLGMWPGNGGRQSPEFYQTNFNGWKHLTYTKDSSNVLRSYINGVLANTNNIGTGSYQNLDLQIDRLVNSNNNVANILIYNRILLDQEILQNYNITKTRFEL
jgi:hypothetical protein